MSISLLACHGQYIDKDSTITNPERVILEQKAQRTVRYACDGSLISDQLEILETEERNITITPPHRYGLENSNFYNLSTGDESVLVWGYDTFTINNEPSTFDMHVEPGLNRIKYRFDYCEDYDYTEDGTEYCDYYGASITGYVYIDVVFDQYIREGIRIIEEQCL